MFKLRIEQSNQYYAVGSKQATAKKAFFVQPPARQPVQQESNLSPIITHKQIYSYLIPTGTNKLAVNTNDDGSTLYNDSSTTEIQALANKFGCTVTGEGKILTSNGVPIDRSELEELAANEIIENKKTEDLNNSLKAMGIDGKVTGSSFSRVPNNYSMFNVETANGKNIVIMQLESGKYMVAEALQTSQDFLNSWDLFCMNNGVSNKKQSEDVLEKYFRKFIGTDVETFKGNLSDSMILQELSKSHK